MFTICRDVRRVLLNGMDQCAECERNRQSSLKNCVNLLKTKKLQNVWNKTNGQNNVQRWKIVDKCDLEASSSTHDEPAAYCSMPTKD